MKRLMLTISAGEWEGINHRPHHFMRRFAAYGWTVLYLEPPATLIAPLKNRHFLKRWRNWLKGIRKAEENLYLLSPPPIMPFGSKFRLVNKLNQALIAGNIKRACKSLGYSEVEVYSFLPTAVDLLPRIRHHRVIYDCVDDHGAFTGLVDAGVISQMERELMAQSDVSFATARQLYEDRKEWSSNFHIIPNGAEYEHFALPSGKVPEELQNVKHPIAGFIGGISDWVDVPLMAQAAQHLPEVNFVLVGPVLTDVSCLTRLDNVRLLGAKPYKELPEYLGSFDVCLVPFKINKLTESVNPIKMFEYLAAGKPVISTPLPEVLAYGEVVAIASGEEETVAAIRQALEPEAQSRQSIELRQQVARENSWDARWQTAVHLIENCR